MQAAAYEDRKSPAAASSSLSLSSLLKPFQRPVIVICGFSASGAFLKPLSGPNRVIVTATKSGAENNYARFGGYFSEAIADPAAGGIARAGELYQNVVGRWAEAMNRESLN